MATLSRTGVIFRRATFGIFSLAIASYSLTPAGEGPAQAQLSSTAPEPMLAQAAAAAATARATLAIQVLSNRADMISGGDALVQIVSSTGASPISLTPWRHSGSRVAPLKKSTNTGSQSRPAQLR